MKKYLNIENLAERHYGVTPGLGVTYFEAASVCLDRHHSSPLDVHCLYNGAALAMFVGWEAPDARTKAAFANGEEATRDGAYAVSLAAVEACEDLVAISRAEKLTGADYYLAPKGAPVDDLESAFRLEVSGTDTEILSALNQRVRQKEAQLKDGLSNKPALASVVGFRLAKIVVTKVLGP